MPTAIQLPVTARYGLVSGTCLALNNLIIVIADYFYQPMLVGVAIAFFLVGAIGFRLHCRYTFAATPSWLGFARYLGALAALTPLATALLWLFSSLLAWPMVIAAPVASGVMIVVNFLITRLAVQGRSVRNASRPLAWR